MSQLTNILKFYSDCHAIDYRSTNLKNFFGREAKNIYLLENLHALSEANIKFKVDSTWGKKVLKELKIHAKEKALYAGALFLMGKSKQLGRSIRVAPPLYLYEAELSDNFGNYRVELDLESPVINPYFLEFVKSQHPEVTVSQEEFASGLPSGPLGVAEVVQIETWIASHLPFLDLSTLSKWYVSHAKLENPRFIYNDKTAQTKDRLICGICVGIIKKQEGSLGVLNELNELSSRNIKKSSLTELFVKSSKPSKSHKTIDINVPIPLSERQKQAIHNAYQHKTSVIIGPPGTGKSYTIAALATDLVSKGKSVLIASKNSQAGKVVAHKIENDIGVKGILIKASRKSYKFHLNNRINNLLSGISDMQETPLHKVHSLRDSISNHRIMIENLTKEIYKREKEEFEWASFFYKYKEGFFQNFKKKWIEYKHRNAQKIWAIKTEIDHLEEKRIRLQRRYIKAKYSNNLQRSLVNNRKDVSEFAKTLDAKSGAEIDEYFSKTDFKNVLNAIPAWIINTGDAHHILPLQSEIFDTLIIDEATQCDIASCLPLIYRAKNVVIIGDPKQLRHISFLSRSMEKKLIEKYGLGNMKHRDQSILDLFLEKISSQAQITFLNEHFRSLPDIISFSNQKFYNESLLIMTSSPITHIHKNIFINQVNGSRNKKSENVKEAEAIVQKIKEIVVHEKDVENDLSSSIGILSPFRAQVTLLKSLVKKSFDLHVLKKHQILIGTPYHFQGEEKDVMLLSFVIDPESPHGSSHYLNKPDVFNVSITRARSLQIAYTSVSSEQVDSEMLLAQYLSHIEAPRRPKKKDPYHSEGDEFMHRVKESIVNWGVDRILTAYAISGVIIDLVVVNNNKTYCIDLIGFPGEFERMFDQYQIDLLNRMGHKVFFLPYSEWHLNNQETLDSLHRFIFSD